MNISSSDTNEKIIILPSVVGSTGKLSRFSVSINGELVGYSNSERGIRQRYSFSMYLYVIANNVLSRMLNMAARQGPFGYHPKCQIWKLRFSALQTTSMFSPMIKQARLQRLWKCLRNFWLSRDWTLTQQSLQYFCNTPPSPSVGPHTISRLGALLRKSRKTCYLCLRFW